jgi:hypothetical protein
VTFASRKYATRNYGVTCERRCCGMTSACDRPRIASACSTYIVGMSPQAFSLTGFERVDGAEYAQSWLVQLIAR